MVWKAGKRQVLRGFKGRIEGIVEELIKKMTEEIAKQGILAPWML